MDETARLHLTLDEQDRHADRLLEQLLAVSAREQGLRVLLLDADRELQQLRPRVAELERLVAERTDWAERLLVTAEERGRVIEELHAAGARSELLEAEVQRLGAELERARRPRRPRWRARLCRLF